MRVVAGELRGRRIAAPPGEAVRPTTDKVREATFNALGSLDLVVDARVADLFAGSGALGIEALSRGAHHCTFVERDRGAVAVLRNNLEELGITERATVVAGDARSRGASLDVDIVFADPPYDVDETFWRDLLDRIRAPFVVAEAPRAVVAPPGWEAVREKRYGRTWVTFLERLERLERLG